MDRLASRGSNGVVAGKHLRHALRGDGVALRLGYAIGGLVLGLVLASMVSTAANAHGRAKDGHHDRVRIASASRAAVPAGRAVAPRTAHRETARPASSLEPAATAAPSEAAQRPVVQQSGPVSADVPVVRTGHPSAAMLAVRPKDGPFAAPSWSWGPHQTIITARSDGPVGCCADGRVCCCQGAAACGSCGMTCCSSALEVACDFDVASDLGSRLHIIGAVDHDGINLGPADRPPAVRI